MKKRMLTLYLALSLILCATVLSTLSQASDFAIISVIRSMPMRADEPIVKDYYVNAGTNNGLVKGAILEAHRKLAVYDNSSSKVLQDTTVPVGTLKIIHVDSTTAVARLIKTEDTKETPITPWADVVVGDAIRVATKQR